MCNDNLLYLLSCDVDFAASYMKVGLGLGGIFLGSLGLDALSSGDFFFFNAAKSVEKIM